jgi:hypothetical protein
MQAKRRRKDAENAFAARRRGKPLALGSWLLSFQFRPEIEAMQGG